MVKENVQLKEEIQKLEVELQEATKTAQVTPLLIVCITFLMTPFFRKNYFII